MPSVSIILVTYNRAYCIGKAIDAILNQTFKDWELIICDDCSTDNTNNVVSQYMAKDERIKYHRNPENYGLPTNRNTGIELSGSPYILFIEDDVVIEPRYVELLYHEFNNGNKSVGAVGGKCIQARKQGKWLKIEQIVGDKVKSKLKVPAYASPYTGLIFNNFTIDSHKAVKSPVLSSWSMFDKQALQDIGYYDDKSYNLFNYSHEESDLFVRLRQTGYSLIYQSRAVSRHNHAPTGGTRTTELKYYYYFVGSHIVYLIKNFKAKSLYMIPLCLGYLFWNGLIASLRIIK